MEKLRSVLVTGAARGIGKGTARWLAAHGWKVAMCDLDARAGAAAARELGLPFFECDVSNETSVARCVQATVAALGGLSGLVNNAGIAGATAAPVEQLTLEDWNRRIGTNLTGVFLMAKHCAPHLRRARGAMVNIASTRALQSEANTESYSASKGGVVALSHALAMSLGPEVRVNCISPGWIDTRDSKLRPQDHAQHPAGRVGTPEDVAALVGYLLSEEAGFVTGQNFVIDGGMTRKMIYEE
jgi:NAD(P)-dependent dehydrogenase (short-subunit alcohol dehydrogenase family)